MDGTGSNDRDAGSELVRLAAQLIVEEALESESRMRWGAIATPAVLCWGRVIATAEHAAIDFYLSAHPLDGQEKMLVKLGVARYVDLIARAGAGISTASLNLAGMATSFRQRNSAKGSKYGIVPMNDPSGVFEVMVFSEVLTAARDLIERAVTESFPILVDVDVQRRDDDFSLFVRGHSPFDQAVAKAPTVVEVFIGGEEAVESLAKLLAREKPGRGVVKLKVPDGASEIEVQLPGRWAVTTETRQAIKAIPGVVHVEMV